MKNQLTLHEAIVIALININKITFSASFDQIASFISQRKLYENRKGNVSLKTQIMLRSTKSNGKYLWLFEQIDDETIKLKIK